MPRPRTRGFARALLVLATALSLPVCVALAPSAGASTTIDGPDVSSYQHPYGARINWSKVKAAGKDFAIVKATEGTSYTNPYFAGDYWHIHEAGLVRGSYHFALPAYPIRDTATAQANYYVAKLGDSLSRAATLPPALDLEVTDGLSRGALVTWAQTFLLRVRQLTGRTPIVYTYPYFWSGAIGDAPALARFPLWMASYDGAPSTPSTLWQFTSGATVEGIRGRVDMSRLTAPSATWSAMSDGRVPAPWPAAVPGAPNHVWATPAAGSAVVHWLPGDSGSSPVTHYWVTASPGGATVRVSGAATVARITGLSNGTPYTFTVHSANDVGIGPLSHATTSLTPMVPSILATSAPFARSYGQGVAVSAVLKRPDNGAPLAGSPVTLLARRHGTSAWTWSRQLTTDSQGRIGWTLHPTTNTDVRFAYAGTHTTLAASSVRTVLVRSGITVHLNSSSIRRGHTVAVYGRISPRVGGVTVLLQRYYSGGWHRVRSTSTSEMGRYRMTLRPRTKSVRTMRTVVASYGGRSRGYSPAVRLTVR